MITNMPERKALALQREAIKSGLWWPVVGDCIAGEKIAYWVDSCWIQTDAEDLSNVTNDEGLYTGPDDYGNQPVFFSK